MVSPVSEVNSEEALDISSEHSDEFCDYCDADMSPHQDAFYYIRDYTAEETDCFTYYSPCEEKYPLSEMLCEDDKFCLHITF